jgi:hypothetical protein
VDPVPDIVILRKSGSAGNRTRDFWICSQELWPLDHSDLRRFYINSSSLCITKKWIWDHVTGTKDIFWHYVVNVKLKMCTFMKAVCMQNSTLVPSAESDAFFLMISSVYFCKVCITPPTKFASEKAFTKCYAGSAEAVVKKRPFLFLFK